MLVGVAAGTSLFFFQHQTNIFSPTEHKKNEKRISVTQAKGQGEARVNKDVLGRAMVDAMNRHPLVARCCGLSSGVNNYSLFLLSASRVGAFAAQCEANKQQATFKVHSKAGPPRFQNVRDNHQKQMILLCYARCLSPRNRSPWLAQQRCLLG